MDRKESKILCDQDLHKTVKSLPSMLPHFVGSKQMLTETTDTPHSVLTACFLIQL